MESGPLAYVLWKAYPASDLALPPLGDETQSLLANDGDASSGAKCRPQELA